MKAIISLLLFIVSSSLNAAVTIYKNDISSLAIESVDNGRLLSSTLYGGSPNIGASSPAACAIKYKLEKSIKGFHGELKSFATDIMEYNVSQKDESLFEYSKAGISVVTSEPLGVCSMMTTFSGEYTLLDKKSKSFKSEFDDLLQLNFYDAGSSFRAGRINDAIDTLEPYMSEAMAMNIYHMEIYNDYGYFLQKAGMNEKAIEFFGVVINRSPKRIAVYLNAADSWWALNNKGHAVDYYRKYSQMMTLSGHSESIPARVLERMKNNE